MSESREGSRNAKQTKRSRYSRTPCSGAVSRFGVRPTAKEMSKKQVKRATVRAGKAAMIRLDEKDESVQEINLAHFSGSRGRVWSFPVLSGP